MLRKRLPIQKSQVIKLLSFLVLCSELVLPRSGVLLMAYSLRLGAVFAFTFGLYLACSLRLDAISLSYVKTVDLPVFFIHI